MASRVLPFVAAPVSVPRRQPTASDRQQLSALVQNLTILALERPAIVRAMAVAVARLAHQHRKAQ